MRLSAGVLKLGVAVVALGLLAACGASTPPAVAPSLTAALVTITVSEAAGTVQIAATPMEVTIFWNAVTGQNGQVAWFLRYEDSAQRYVDRVEVRVKTNEKPDIKALLADRYDLISGSLQLSGPVRQDPGKEPKDWFYDVVALKNGVEVGRLDPRIIIRK